MDASKYTELFHRLERATAALENIVLHNSPAGSTLTDAASIVTAPGAGASQPQQHHADSSVPASSAPDVVMTDAGETETASTKAFADFLELYVDPFVSLSNEMDELVGAQASKLASAFQFQAQFIKAASESAKPDFASPVSAALLTPLQEIIGAINDFKDKNRTSEYFPHLNAIAEGAGVLSWFLVDTPISYIPEIKDSATFWTNKVLKEFKEKDARHVEWVKQYLGIFDGLKLYVKQYHTTGLVWGSEGDFASKLSVSLIKDSTPSPPAATSAPAAPAAGGAPPPPPPPPADLFDDNKPSSSTSSAPSGGISAVFSELSQGEGITKGLKKVDKSQMTHKNPELRQSSLVRSSSSGSTASNSSGKKAPPIPKKPNSLSRKPKPEPVVELQVNKWIVKNVEGRHDIVLDVELSQSVFIADSKDSTVQLKGKVNAVSLSSTTKVALVVDSAISGVSVINSKKFGIQVLGSVPQISIDQSDEGQVYLGADSLNTEIYTTTTTGLNVNIPGEEEGDFKEINVPEQFKFEFKSGKLVGEVVEHAG